MTGRPTAAERYAWLALIVVLLVPIWWGADATFPWESDNIAPGSVLKGMAVHFGPGWYSTYGPLPYYLTALVYAPLLAILKLAGELGRPASTYPFGFAHPDSAITTLVVAARLVTLLLGLGIVWLATRRERERQGPAAGWLPPLFFLGSIQFAFYTRTSNVDIQALFWLWLSIELVERAASLRTLALAAAAASLALCSKEQSGPMTVVLVAAAAWKALRILPGPPARRAGGALGVLLAAGAAYALAWFLPWNLDGWRAHHQFLFESALGPRAFPATPAGFATLAVRCVEYLPLAFGWPVLAGLVLALLLRVSWRGLGLRVLCSAVFLVGFIARVGYLFPRFLLPLLVLAVPLGARGVMVALETPGRRRRARAALGTGIVLASLLGAPLLTGLMLADPRLPAERWLQEHAAPGATVELSGNGHVNLRVPHDHPVERITEKILHADPRGPAADLVVITSIDTMLLQRDPRVRSAWWDVVHAPPPSGRYRLAADFPRPALAEWSQPMWICPGITIYQRVPATAGAREPAPADAGGGRSPR
jgi:hypothetical protein